MSRSLKQTIWGAVILAIALVFVMQFRPGAQLQEMGAQGGEPTCAVENDGRCIVTQSDFTTAFRLIASGNLEEDERRDMMRQIVLEGLIQRSLLLDDAARLGLSVSDEEVSRTLSRGLVRVSLPADQESGMLAFQLGLSQPDGAARAVPIKDPKTDKFDYERYKKWVQRVSGKTLKDFREFATREELAARVRALVKARARVSDAEAYEDYAAANAKLVAEHVQFNRDFYQRHADASSDAVAAWAGQNAKELDEAWGARKDEFAPTCRRTRHILVRVDDSGDKDAATKKARESIDAAKKRLEKGDKFADVARAVSQDAQSAASGGLLGCFAAGKLARPNTAKAVDDAAFALAKGKVSDVVESTFGLHLVVVDEVFEGAAAEKEGRAEIARERYLKAEGDRLAAAASKEVLASVKAGKSLQQALDDHLAALTKPKKGDAKAEKKPKKPEAEEADRPRLETGPEFTTAGPPFPGAEAPMQAATALFALEVGAVAPETIKTYTGYAVARVKEKKALDAKEWDEKRSQLVEALRREKQRDALIRYLHVLREKSAKTLTYKIKDERKGKADKGAKPDGKPTEEKAPDGTATEEKAPAEAPDAIPSQE